MKHNPVKKIKNYLKQNKVDFISYYHNPVYTAEDLAKHLNIPVENVVKTYLLGTNGEHLLLVIPSFCEIDIEKLEVTLSKSMIKFLPEGTQERVFPDCEADALPPFGNLYGVPVHAEQSLGKRDEIVFFAGTFRDSMKIKLSDFIHLVKPVMECYCCEYK